MIAGRPLRLLKIVLVQHWIPSSLEMSHLQTLFNMNHARQKELVPVPLAQHETTAQPLAPLTYPVSENPTTELDLVQPIISEHCTFLANSEALRVPKALPSTGGIPCLSSSPLYQHDCEPPPSLCHTHKC